jgi:hypothetical protein
MIYLETLSVFTSKSKKSDLEKICKENLAYLIDEGYEISVNEIQTGIHPFKSVHYSIAINNKDYNKVLFKWDDIKYDFMAFFEILTNNYKIYKKYIRFFYKSDDNFFFPEMHKDYNKEQILTDNIDSNNELLKLK